MYAIVEIAGQQFKVEKEQEIFVHRLEGEAGSAVEFGNVLLIDNAGKVTVGTPSVNGAMVKAKIVEHLKGDKVIVFHKKRRKGYQKENGHREALSKVVVEDILTSTPKKAAPKKEEVKKEAKTEVKEKVAPKTATKKPAAKKTETAKPKAAPKKEVKTDSKVAPKVEAKKETKSKAPAKPKAEKKTEPKKEEKKEDSKE